MSEPIPPAFQDRLLAAIRQLIRAEFPQLTYLGAFEYSVQSTDGTTIDANPVDTTIPLPALTKVPIRGHNITPTKGARAVVGFLNSDPTKPYVFAIDPPHVNETHAPSGTLTLGGGGYATTEHVATVEGVVNMFVNFVYFLNTAGDPSSWSSATKLLDPTSFPTNFVTAFTTWLSNCNSPLVPTAVAGGGTPLPGTTALVQSTLSSKVNDVVYGLTPVGIGAPSVHSG